MHPYFKDIVRDGQAREIPGLFDFEGLKRKKNKKLLMELAQLYQAYLTTF